MSVNLRDEIAAYLAQQEAESDPSKDASAPVEPAISPEQFLVDGELGAVAFIPEKEFRDSMRFDWDRSMSGHEKPGGKRKTSRNSSSRKPLTQTQKTVLTNTAVRLLLIPYSAENIIEAGSIYLGVHREFMQEVIEDAFSQVELDTRYTKGQVRSVVEKNLMKIARDDEATRADLLKVTDKMTALWGIKPDDVDEDDIESALIRMDEIDKAQSIEQLAAMRQEMRRELEARRMQLLRSRK